MARAPAERCEGSQQSDAFAPREHMIVFPGTAIMTPKPMPERNDTRSTPPALATALLDRNRNNGKPRQRAHDGALLYIASLMFTAWTCFPRAFLQHARDPATTTTSTATSTTTSTITTTTTTTTATTATTTTATSYLHLPPSSFCYSYYHYCHTTLLHPAPSSAPSSAPAPCSCPLLLLPLQLVRM